ncbi:MAG: extracellular solute-binding protein [Hyphomicrobiaceae bacterium]
MHQPSRRTILSGLAAITAGPFATRVVAAAPPAEAITPALIEAAKKEGVVNWYTAMDLPAAEAMAKAFEAKFAGISVKVERSGSERVFQRIAQEYGSRITQVDIASSADAAHLIAWKREGWLQPYMPEDVVKHFKPGTFDADGCFATHRVHLSVIAYNTTLVKPEDVPKSFADLLDPKWSGRMVKANPNYSGTILTATFQMARDLGWGYFEKLAKQKIMQVQSSTDPPKKIALGERALMADGNHYNVLQQKDKGAPLEVVFPLEGSPYVSNPSGVFKSAPHPNAARLLHNWMFSGEGQQMIIDYTGMYSMHAGVKPKPGRKPLADIKTMKEDPEAVLAQADDIKAKYTQYFKV